MMTWNDALARSTFASRRLRSSSFAAAAFSRSYLVLSPCLHEVTEREASERTDKSAINEREDRDEGVAKTSKDCVDVRHSRNTDEVRARC
jgi:hypothetical protein